MNEKRALIIEIVFGVMSFSFGLFYGAAVPFKEQAAIYDVLRNTSAIIFGVVGAWYAVLTPIYLSNMIGKGEGRDFSKQLLRGLTHPIKYSVYILCITVGIYVFTPFIKLLLLSEFTKTCLKSVSFGIVCCMSTLMLFTLLRALMPNDFVNTSIELSEKKEEYLEEANSNIKKG
jgi:hypothetical protein